MNSSQQGVARIKDLHLGITPWQISSGIEVGALCEQAVLAESWGYHSFFLPESHFAGNTSLPEPLMLLAAVAARTERISLGTTSYLLPIRNPLQAAEQVAVLDSLSGGRLILGLGRGFQPGMLAAFGVDSKTKRQIFENTLAQMLELWRGESIATGSGSLTLSPLPQQQPHPPLWVAAFGPKAITQVGSMGLPYLASPMETLAQLQANFELHDEALRQAGMARPEPIVIMRTIFVSEDPGACAAVRARLEQVGAGVNAAKPPNPVDEWCLIGSSEEVRSGIERYREQLGMTHLIAVRPRVTGIPQPQNRESMRLLAELVQRH